MLVVEAHTAPAETTDSTVVFSSIQDERGMYKMHNEAKHNAKKNITRPSDVCCDKTVGCTIWRPAPDPDEEESHGEITFNCC